LPHHGKHWPSQGGAGGFACVSTFFHGFSRSWLRSEPRALASGSPVAPNLAVRNLHENATQISLACELEGFDGRAARAGGIAVGHHVNGNRRLLLALAGH